MRWTTILALGSAATRASATAFILTGGPGAGKTALAIGLELGGEVVVRESATDLIEYHRACGVARPWERPDYQIEMARLQLRREKRLPATGRAFLDRTALDCLAYCQIAGRAPAPELLRIIDEIGSSRYAPFVFMVAGSGAVERTPYRVESADEAAAIARALREVFTARGFAIVDVPWAPVPERVAFVRANADRSACDAALGADAPVPAPQSFRREHE